MRQHGISLVEVAVAIVIIGLLLGGALQGTALLQSMRVKDLMATAADLSSAARQFRERHHYLPGDWIYTANEIPNVTAGGNGNGVIDTPQPPIGPQSESTRVFNHLFHAGFIRGGGLAPKTPYGNVRVTGNSIAAGSLVAAGTNPLPATIINVIEFDNLPCDVALELDLKLDDGNLAQGRVRASVASCMNQDPVASIAIPL